MYITMHFLCHIISYNLTGSAAFPEMQMGRNSPPGEITHPLTNKVEPLPRFPVYVNTFA
jgi:hypothetical protein